MVHVVRGALTLLQRRRQRQRRRNTPRGGRPGNAVGLAEVDHKTEVTSDNFEDRVIRFSEETQQAIDKLIEQDDTNKHELRKLLHQIDKRLERVEELVN